jgi:hypothetical protein
LAVEPKNRFDSAAELSRKLLETCPPCGPEKLAEFILAHASAKDQHGNVVPEPTLVANRPVSPTQSNKFRRAIVILSFFVLVLITVVGVWYIQSQADYSDDLFISPRPLTFLKLSPPAQEPLAIPMINLSKTTNQTDSHPQPPIAEKPIPTDPSSEPVANVFFEPHLQMSVETGWRMFVDHELQEGRSFKVKEYQPHLIRLVPLTGEQPEVIVRLTPPVRSSKKWRLTLSSNPWMNIKLGRQALGQTPRSDLKLPFGQSTLLLHRGDLSVRILLETQKSD